MDEDVKCLYTLEAVVGNAPEDSPQSSIQTGINKLATRFSQLSDQLGSLQGRLAMSSFETWDKQDGITGLVPQALTAYRSTYPMLEESIKTTCEGHPVGTMVFLYVENVPDMSAKCLRDTTKSLNSGDMSNVT